MHFQVLSIEYVSLTIDTIPYGTGLETLRISDALCAWQPKSKKDHRAVSNNRHIFDLLGGLPTFLVQIKYTTLLYRFYCMVWYTV